MCACAGKRAFGWQSLVSFDSLISLQEESKEIVPEDVKEDFTQSILLCYVKHIVKLLCHALSNHLAGREPLQYRVILEFPFGLENLFGLQESPEGLQVDPLPLPSPAMNKSHHMHTFLIISPYSPSITTKWLHA